MTFNNDYYRIVRSNPMILVNQENAFFENETNLDNRVKIEYERTIRVINDILSNDPFYDQNQLAVINDTVDEIKGKLAKDDNFTAGEYIICLQNLLGIQIKLTSIVALFILDNKSIEDYVDVSFFNGTCFITDNNDNDDDIKKIV